MALIRLDVCLQSDLCLGCLHMVRTGFLMMMLIDLFIHQNIKSRSCSPDLFVSLKYIENLLIHCNNRSLQFVHYTSYFTIGYQPMSNISTKPHFKKTIKHQ